MVFDGLFKKSSQKDTQRTNVQGNFQGENQNNPKPPADFDFEDLDRSFEREMESPENLVAEEFLETTPQKNHAQISAVAPSFQKPVRPAPSIPPFPKKIPPQAHPKPEVKKKPAPEKPKTSVSTQNIPAFVRLDKYKEIKISLRDMKKSSLDLRKTIESLKQNRDGGTELLKHTVDGLEKIEDDIDKIKGVLRT